MKKHLLLSLSASVLFFFTCSSQVISKKDKIFGASASVSFTTINQNPQNFSDFQYTNVGLIPSFAWVIKDNLALGFKANIGYSRTESKAAFSKTVHTDLNLGPELFIRKYKPLVNSFGLTFNHAISAYYYRRKTKDSQNNPDIIKSTDWNTGYSFKPGAYYKFSNRFIGEANFGGVYLTYGNYTAKSFSVAASFLSYLNVGFQYIIPGKKS